MVTPKFAADVTAALRTECALKIFVSIPDFVSTDFNHLAIVDDDTGLYGLIRAIKSWDCSDCFVSLWFYFHQHEGLLQDTVAYCLESWERKSLPLPLTVWTV